MRDIDFFQWRKAITQQFQAATANDQVYAILQQQTHSLEYDWFALCVRHPVPFTRPKLSLHTTYPKAWMEHYQAENYFAIDPVLKMENYRNGHLPWSESLFSETQAFWSAARDHGLQRGITQSLMLPNRAHGFLSVSRQGHQPNPHSDDETELRLQTLMELSLATLLRLEDTMVMAPEMRFSKRELEILKWTAEGKTSAEIAIILSISENTVNFHQKNMQKKFNAPNKTQIACYAAATGVI
ncbi:transcriptional regulator SdiA [Enterobacter sp. CC120223-11]|uniref:transcriptional regulator SdiA n=1 Tax=Enterobacter sp. CC120223-11 TaxID=1378073 RepID=UPI000BC3AB3D|nr:transcriptional regulator SdiA [Enterobacter sp. CC120223-11]SNY79707.1 LuxR family transcriptional regulator [Enterobacter sp. CC120223-11]